jgi:hypothetical protein
MDMDKHHSSFFASDAGWWFRGVHEDVLVIKRGHWLQALIALAPASGQF